RASLIYKPVDGTTVHLGYARYFTPPSQVIAGPTNLALFDNTTQQPTSCPPPHPESCNSPVLPERSHYFDVGVTQKVMPGLEVGVDTYYKLARDLLDDGQFGQAYVLTGFNYDKAFNKGVELTAKYKYGNLRAYANLAWAKQMGTNVVSNQFLFGPDELAYIATHYIYTDHAQTWTGSAGVSYLWNGTRFSTNMIYGSGLRSDFANTGHLPLYTQVNAGISHEFKWDDFKPTTMRFDVINVFDTIHEIRNGSGIGVFAPQYGPRRAYYVGLSQNFTTSANAPPSPTPHQRMSTAMKPLLSTLKKSLLISALLAPVIADPSYADGMPGGYSGPPAACCFTWTGFYFGVNGGGAWTDSPTIRLAGTATGTGGLGSEIADGTTPSQAPLDWSKSFTGGAQIGYNVQLGKAVVGVEADVQWLNAYANFVVVSTNPLRPTITTSANREMTMLATLPPRFAMTLWPTP